MKNNTDYVPLKIDLTFTAASNDVIKELAHPLFLISCNNAKNWSQKLTNWLQIIRSNIIFQCPEMVRKANFISLGLIFTDDSTIKNLNYRWRNKRQKTDVISFPALDQNIVLPEDQCVEIGDIIISIQTAEQQAKDFGHSLEIELGWLVSHGLLHLLGWDHPTPETLDSMLNLQKQLIDLTDTF